MTKTLTIFAALAIILSAGTCSLAFLAEDTLPPDVAVSK